MIPKQIGHSHTAYYDHRIVRLRPIVTLCYYIKQRSHTAIGLWLVVVYRTIDGRRSRAISILGNRAICDSDQPSIVRSTITFDDHDRSYYQSWCQVPDRRSIMAFGDRSHDQSVHHATDSMIIRLATNRMINRRILQPIA